MAQHRGSPGGAKHGETSPQDRSLLASVEIRLVLGFVLGGLETGAVVRFVPAGLVLGGLLSGLVLRGQPARLVLGALRLGAALRLYAPRLVLSCLLSVSGLCGLAVRLVVSRLREVGVERGVTVAFRHRNGFAARAMQAFEDVAHDDSDLSHDEHARNQLRVSARSRSDDAWTSLLWDQTTAFQAGSAWQTPAAPVVRVAQASAAVHETPDGGHELVGLGISVAGLGADNAVVGVVVEQAERDLVECGLHG